jgi:hypothetical protein
MQFLSSHGSSIQWAQYLMQRSGMTTISYKLKVYVHNHDVCWHGFIHCTGIAEIKVLFYVCTDLERSWVISELDGLAMSSLLLQSFCLEAGTIKASERHLLLLQVDRSPGLLRGIGGAGKGADWASFDRTQGEAKLVSVFKDLRLLLRR